MLKRCSYEKFVCKMLMKLTAGVNFTNILRAPFLHESSFCSFSIQFLFYAVWVYYFSERKLAQKIDDETL